MSSVTYQRIHGDFTTDGTNRKEGRKFFTKLSFAMAVMKVNYTRNSSRE